MEVACFHNILKFCMLAQMHGILLQQQNLSSCSNELISRPNGFLAFCNSQWAEIASCPIPNACI